MNTDQSRYKGKFCKKNVVKWKNNVIQSNKTRQLLEDKLSKIKLTGRRLVDMEELIRELWCYKCKSELSLRNAYDEVKHGLASIYKVKCQTCNSMFEVNTSKIEPSSSMTKSTYTINSKIVLGAIESGIGNTHLNKLLTAANVPPISHTLFKRHERKVGVVIEEIAKDSCLDNLNAERELTIQNEGLRLTTNWTEDNIVKLTISYDAGWQKKGSGRSYNSLTGHGTAIGFYSGKVVGYATRNKRCATCENIERKPTDGNNNNSTQVNHDCRKDFEGSSKAMEADMASEIFLRNPHFMEVNVRLGTLIGDDDSSTIATLRKGADYEIKKWSDKNHAVTKLSKCLYAMKISTPVVKYFKYCFSCVLEKNKNNIEETRRGLLNIVPHAFDFHSECGEWCTYKQDPTNYRHKILPGGKGLISKGNLNQEKLQDVFNIFASNAAKLSPCGSSQSNESLNRTIASKAPKMLHYGGSSSNDFRVGSAILQKNIGNTAITEVCTKLNCSPTTKLSNAFRLKNDQIANKRRLKTQTVAFKKRRRQLFNRKLNNSNRATQKEGICYESGCGLDLTIDFIDEPNFISEHGNYKISEVEVVIFDLETTGFGSNKEIIQIAATSDSKQFDIYIMPLGTIAPRASEITGLSIQQNILLYKSTPVMSCLKHDAAISFLDFLKNIGKKIVLIAHNCFTFDRHALLAFMKNENLLDQFKSIVVGFSDSLPLFKTKLKDVERISDSYKQEDLAKEFLSANASADAHNAIYDVEVLKKLMEHSDINITKEDIVELALKQIKKKQLNNLKQSLQCLKRSKGNKSDGLSSQTINKIVTAGITMDHLLECFSSGGEREIEILFGQDIGGKPRVTKNKKIIIELCTKLKSIHTPV